MTSSPHCSHWAEKRLPTPSFRGLVSWQGLLAAGGIAGVAALGGAPLVTGLGYLLVGKAILDVGADFTRFTTTALGATTEDHFDQSRDFLIAGVGNGGAQIIFALTASQVAKRITNWWQSSPLTWRRKLREVKKTLEEIAEHQRKGRPIEAAAAKERLETQLSRLPDELADEARQVLRGETTARRLATGEVPLGTPFKENVHNLVTKQYRNGELISERQWVSGELTDAEKALAKHQGVTPEWRIGDTENRALRAITLRRGDKLVLEGQWAPCDSCKSAMRRRYRATGVDIQYRYLSSDGSVRVWSARENGFIFVEQ